MKDNDLLLLASRRRKTHLVGPGQPVWAPGAQKVDQQGLKLQEEEEVEEEGLQPQFLLLKKERSWQQLRKQKKGWT